MVKFIRCIRRRDDITADEFRRYWNDERYSGALAGIAKAAGAQRCVMDLTLRIAANAQLIEREGLGNPYDGVVEFWFDSPQVLAGALDSDEVRAIGRPFRELEAKFVDHADSKEFIVDCTDVHVG